MSDKGVKNNAFLNNTNITSVEFGGDCSYVGTSAFRGCTSLKEINADNKLTTVGKYAFANTILCSATFNNLTTIYEYAFEDCVELSSITIGGCIEIGSSAFKGCENLKSVYNKNYTITPTVIYDEAFKGCKNLNTISLEYCKDIKTMAFQNCIGLTKISLNRCINIGSSAFKGCENLSQISLSVCSNIYKDAFVNCKNLTKVYIPNTSIFATLNSFSIFHILSEDGTYNINENTYFYISPKIIDKYKINRYWKEYKDYMIMAAENNQIIYKSIRHEEEDLNSYVIENLLDTTSSDSDDDGHYYYKKKFGLITFKSKIDRLNFKLFTDESKKNITSIDIPIDCTHIDEKMFEGYTSLTNVTTLTDSLIKISDFAFKDCKSLTSFNIPESIRYLGEGVFAGCVEIKKFEGNYVKYNNKAVVYNNILISVVPIDDSVTEGRIYNISKIDKDITILGKYCFSGCKKLRRVDIPKNITEIHDGAFEGCENLREVHVENTTPPTLGENVFGDVSEYIDFKIFVPENSLLTYQKKWGDYKLTKDETLGKYIYPKAQKGQIIYYGSNKIKPNHKDSDQKTVTNGDYFKITNVGKTIKNDLYFINNTTVTKVILNESIKLIDENTFKNCSELKYIYIPDTLEKLSSGCFHGCKSLIRIHIPNGSNENLYINSIDDVVVSSPSIYSTPSNVVSPIINDYISSSLDLADGIFYDCTSLKEFGSYYKGCVSDDNRCYINKYNTLQFFAQGDLLEKKYTIPDNIQTIGKSAFRGSTIESIEMKSSTITIDEYAFADCKDLTGISGWNNVKTISNNAFAGCKNLQTTELPNSLTTIGDYAFDMCNSLGLKNIPDDVTKIGNFAFRQCYEITNGDKPFGLGSITTINKCVFTECSGLTNININESITTIDEGAFSGCSGLATLSIPKESKLTTINNRAFENCSSIETITIPDSLKDIGESAFYNCSKLKSVNVYTNSNLNSIGNSAFEDCSELESLHLPNSLTHIGIKAFANCTSFGGIIGSDSDSDNIISMLTIPKNVETLGDNCFQNTYIQTLNIPEGSKLEKIPDYAFNGCSNLINIFIEESRDFKSNIKTIGLHAFDGCINLCNITKNGKTQSLELPNSIEYVGDYAFNGCQHISSVRMPENLKNLGNYCFNTSLNTIFYIPHYLITPPKFSKLGQEVKDIDSNPVYPFGQSFNNGKIVQPEIYIYTLNYNEYAKDPVWRYTYIYPGNAIRWSYTLK